LPVLKVQTANFKSLTKKPITASDEEANQNPRARSAKLRGVEKLS
jgi:16S rRNA C1402 N4-methylase RsmH